MTTWWLCRHGESTANAEGVWSGHKDVGLTELGQAQARTLVRRLSGERISAVVASDLQRAWRTAELAGEGRSWAVRQDPRLRERHAGAWTGRRVAAGLPKADRAIWESLYGRPPEGETMFEVIDRALAALVDADRGVPTLVVCHGGVIRGLLAGLDVEPPWSRAIRYKVKNTELIRRELPRGAWAGMRRRLHEL